MNRNNRVQIVLILLFLFGAIVFAQNKVTNEDQQLREEILAVYQSRGEKGLTDFVKRNQDKISNKFIVDFTELGFEQREEKWLKISEIMAKEKKDKKTLVNVLYQTGECFRLISEYKKATEYFNKALPISLELKNQVGQGYVYMRIGNIYYLTGENLKALEMYDKALPFFEKSGEPIGQGNVYWSKGKLYLIIGEPSKALKMYDRALPFFEKAETPLGQGNVYKGKGDIYSHTGDNSSALKMYDKALTFYEEKGSHVSKGELLSIVVDEKNYFF